MIVVIAVIGVLAAILTPMLIGYVFQSRIASANATASRIRDCVTYFMTEADCNNYGMSLSKNQICDVDIAIGSTGWTATLSDTTVFSTKSDILWTASASSNSYADVSTSLDATERFLNHIAKAFPDEKYGYLKLRLAGGMCTALYYTKDQNTAVVNFPGFGGYNGWSVPDYAWMDDEQGLYSSGIIVGTSPMLPLSDV